MTTIAHIINPVIVPSSSDLFRAQPITFKTLKTAKEFAAREVDVTLFTTQFPEDRAFVPEGFRVLRDLDRSILDFGQFHQNRKLPLLKDILDRLYEASEAEYLIYTNVDIAVMPHFYLAVNRLLKKGHDGIVINRRTISKDHEDDDLPLMYAEIGDDHPGHDCFIFRRDAYPRYVLGNVCIGVLFVGRALICNLACHANNFMEFKQEHLTFHIGDDRVAHKQLYEDYTGHNRREWLQSLTELESRLGSFDENTPVWPYLPITKPYDQDKGGLENKKPGKVRLSVGAQRIKTMAKILLPQRLQQWIQAQHGRGCV